MSQLFKLVRKVFSNSCISYIDAEKLFFNLEIQSSHHIFRKEGCKAVSIKRRPQLLAYQIKELKEALKKHGY